MRSAVIHPNLVAFIVGGLCPEEAAEVRSYLASCLSFRKEFEELENVYHTLQVACPFSYFGG